MLPFRGNIEDYDEYLVFEILLIILTINQSILLPIEQTISFLLDDQIARGKLFVQLGPTIVSSRTDFEFLRKNGSINLFRC